MFELDTVGKITGKMEFMLEYVSWSRAVAAAFSGTGGAGIDTQKLYYQEKKNIHAMDTLEKFMYALRGGFKMWQLTKEPRSEHSTKAYFKIFELTDEAAAYAVHKNGYAVFVADKVRGLQPVTNDEAFAKCFAKSVQFYGFSYFLDR